jgi:nicotinate-nucleotide pyrophosphorylase (carboxylating)
MMKQLPSPDVIRKNVQAAIAEDIGIQDVTAQLIPNEQMAIARIVCRDQAIICGIPWAMDCFSLISPETEIHWKVEEGAEVVPQTVLCEIHGKAKEILTAERVVLNFLQTLSSTATVTKQYVDAIAGTKAKIMDTRKTIPGLRLAQKYAVTIGGGINQRLGLYDGILIKENHISAAGSIKKVLEDAKKCVEIAGDPSLGIQIEVETLEQLRDALQCGATSILLDNFNLENLVEAVKINQGQATLEASGGIDLSNVKMIAQTGVDRISIGNLTKNIHAIDLSMRFFA